MTRFDVIVTVPLGDGTERAVALAPAQASVMEMRKRGLDWHAISGAMGWGPTGAYANASAIRRRLAKDGLVCPLLGEYRGAVRVGPSKVAPKPRAVLDGQGRLPL